MSPEGPAPAAVTVFPATADRWEDLTAVFGTRGDPSWCWCQFFVTTGNGYAHSPEANRAALHDDVVTSTTPPGLLAHHDGEPAGWLQLGPRERFPRVTGNSRLVEVVAGLDTGNDPGAASDDRGAAKPWRVTCFVVKVGHRRKGVAHALLLGAIDFAREHGATSLEGHPVDVAALPGKAHSANLYHGVLSTFLAAGFTEVGRTAPARPVVWLELDHVQP